MVTDDWRGEPGFAETLNVAVPGPVTRPGEVRAMKGLLLTADHVQAAGAETSTENVCARASTVTSVVDSEVDHSPPGLRSRDGPGTRHILSVGAPGSGPSVTASKAHCRMSPSYATYTTSL